MASERKSEQAFNDIDAAHSVLDREIEGLKALSAAMDDKFIKAVDMIYNMKGRVIISGMGKSGHIARKIAATMASTGTPAHFVHPGEASHGDLGMVTKDDLVILLSNSGETVELTDIIEYTRRFEIPMIAIVRRHTSTLVEAADLALVLPEIPEASPVGAPTTSTTMMLALGDALAVALIERQGFNEDDFKVYHPGGKLGAALLKVKDLMHGGEHIPFVTAEQPMSEVLLTMTSKRLGCAAIIDTDNKLLGIITDGDLRRHMDKELMDTKASEIMTVNPTVITANSLASQALQIMNSKSITNLVVVDEQHVVHGVVHIHDILRAGVS